MVVRDSAVPRQPISGHARGGSRPIKLPTPTKMQVPVVADQGNQVTPRRIVEVPGTFVGSTAVRPHSVKQGFKVQLSQGAIGLDCVRVVRDEQFAVDEMHVGFNAAKAPLQRIQERMRVFVIVVGVGVGRAVGMEVSGVLRGRALGRR